MGAGGQRVAVAVLNDRGLVVGNVGDAGIGADALGLRDSVGLGGGRGAVAVVLGFDLSGDLDAVAGGFLTATFVGAASTENATVHFAGVAFEFLRLTADNLPVRHVVAGLGVLDDGRLRRKALVGVRAHALLACLGIANGVTLARVVIDFAGVVNKNGAVRAVRNKGNPPFRLGSGQLAVVHA
ncbi:hypothetical protein D9M71_536140 [compost metagenome]